MAQLEYSWNLKRKIEGLNVSEDLRNAIGKYIKLHESDKSAGRIADVLYRCNLHYIIDNIKKETLLSELNKLIAKHT